MQIVGCGLSAKQVLSRRSIPAALLAIVCAALLLKASVFFLRAAHVAAYPYEWSTMDGYYVYFGSRLLSGLPIYFGYDSLLMPFEYVPLYPAAIGVLSAVFGPGVWYERSFGLLCSLGIAILVARIVNRRTENRCAAATAGLLFFAPAAISVWYIVRGIDLFAALLALFATTLVEQKDRGGRRLMLTGPVFLLAFYAKQTAVFPAAAACLFVLSRDFKKGVLMSAGLVGAVLAVFALLQLASGGWFFENAFLTTSRNPYHFGRFMLFGRAFLLQTGIAFGIAFIQAGRGIGRRPDLWSLYFCFTLISILLSGKAGAALSYFVPLFSATCICVGLTLGDSTLSEKRPRVYAAALILMAAQAAVFFAGYVPVPTGKAYERARMLDEHVKNHPGRILSERIDSFAVRNGRELNVEAVQLPSLIIRGRFDQYLLVRAIDNKDFSLILYSGVYFRGLPQVRLSIFENYRVIDRINVGLFYGETMFTVLVPTE